MYRMSTLRSLNELFPKDLSNLIINDYLFDHQAVYENMCWIIQHFDMRNRHLVRCGLKESDQGCSRCHKLRWNHNDKNGRYDSDYPLFEVTTYGRPFKHCDKKNLKVRCCKVCRIWMWKEEFGMYGSGKQMRTCKYCVARGH